MKSKPAMSAVVLSAGFSSRMGRFKPLLRIGEKTVVERAVSVFREGGIDDVVVVVGHRAGEIRPAVARAGGRSVENEEYAKGMFTSVKAGARSVSSQSQAFFVMPVDIPLVRPSTVTLLVRTYLENPGRIVYPVFDSRRGHPPLIPSPLASAIAKSSSGDGLRGFLGEHEALALELPVPDRNILLDMDSPENYEEALRRAAQNDIPTRQECETILGHTFPVSEKVLFHSRMVERLSFAIAAALIDKGEKLDLGLASAGALLHDIAKGQKDHAKKGAEMIRELGFDRVADIVARHTDLNGEQDGGAREAEIVYIADKLIANDRFVSLSSRFETALGRFGHDPLARDAIERRRKTAESVKKNLETLLDRSLESFFPARKIDR